MMAPECPPASLIMHHILLNHDFSTDDIMLVNHAMDEEVIVSC